jgi:hypothetical protein
MGYPAHNMKQYYITFRNYGKPEQTPIMPDAEKNAQRNVKLLKAQGATAVRIHLVEESNG